MSSELDVEKRLNLIPDASPEQWEHTRRYFAQHPELSDEASMILGDYKAGTW